MADISGNFYRASKVREGTSPSSPGVIVGEPVNPVNPIGSNPSYLTLTDTNDSSYIGKDGFVPIVVGESGLTLVPLPQIQENGLISGGIVQWTGIGYVFNVSGAFYRIGGVLYESQPIQITLSTPDVTNNRIDVFAVDINGVSLDITGTPIGSPVKPQIDPQTQLELTSVIVTAASSVPTLTEEVIYDENTEWTGSSTGTGTVSFNSAVDPYKGSVSINATNIQNGLKIRLTDGSDYDLLTVQTLGLQINLKATMGAGLNIGVTFLNSSGSPISTELILNHNKTLLGYQFVGIALSQFSFTSFNARSIEFRYIRTKGTIIYSGFFLDIIKLEGGINPPQTVGSFLGLSDTPTSYSGQAGKTVAVKADESGLEFVTGGGGGTDPDAVHYNVADGKNSTEKQQARDNIGSIDGIYQTESTSGVFNNFIKTTNLIRFTSSTTTFLSGVVAGMDGERIAITNNCVGIFKILNENISSTATNRFSISSDYTLYSGETVVFRYDGISTRWVFDIYYYSGIIKNLPTQILNQTVSQTTPMLHIEAPASGGTTLLSLKNLQVASNKAFIKGFDYNGTVLYDFRDSYAGVPNNIGTAIGSVNAGSRNLMKWGNNSTAGSINNLSLSDATQNTVVFLGAGADITGVIPLANTLSGWRSYYFRNGSGGNITIRHQSASSTAANRFNIIGLADLIVPDLGWVFISYTQGSRWEIVSKNF